MSELGKQAISGAIQLETRDLIRNGSAETSKLRQSPEFCAAQTLRKAADRITALEAENAALVDRLENLTIAIGMGRDLEGVISEARATLAQITGEGQ